MSTFRLPSRHTALVAVALATLVVVAVVLAFVLRPGYSGSSAPASDPEAGSWARPWHPGNPKATTFGEAFQPLAAAHPPTIDRDSTFWLGPAFHGWYPYVQAIAGAGSDVMLSTTLYADRSSADYAHLELVAYSTRPLPDGSPSEGSKLAEKLAHAAPQTTAGYTWVDLRAPDPGWQAAVQISPTVIVKVIRMDGSVPNLPEIIARLRVFGGPAPAAIAPASRPHIRRHRR